MNGDRIAIRHAKNMLARRPDFIATLEARGQQNAMFYRLAELESE